QAAHVGQEAVVEGDGDPGGQRLALVGARQQERGGFGLAGQVGQDRGLGVDEVVVDAVCGGPPDLGGAVFGRQSGGLIVEGDRGGVAEGARKGEDFGGVLAGCGYVDEDVGHGGLLDELLGGEELGEAASAVALIGDDLAGGALGPVGGGEHLGGGGTRADFTRV